MATKKSADMKVRKKRWIDIVTPSFSDQTIGQTHVYDLNSALKKKLKVNLMNLIGDPRKQNTDILFETEQLKGETAVIANVKGFNMQQPALKKLVRRGKTKIQDSFKCYTGDKKPVIVKIFILTRHVVNKSVATKIRTTIKQLTVNKIAKMTFEEFIKEIIYSRPQKEMKSILQTIYPIRSVEYNTVKIVADNKGAFVKPKEIEDLPKKKDSSDKKDAKTEVKSDVKAPKKKKETEEESAEETTEETTTEEQKE